LQNTDYYNLKFEYCCGSYGIRQLLESWEIAHATVNNKTNFSIRNQNVWSSLTATFAPFRSTFCLLDQLYFVALMSYQVELIDQQTDLRPFAHLSNIYFFMYLLIHLTMKTNSDELKTLMW
jgi:hypothetical protein